MIQVAWKRNFLSKIIFHEYMPAAHTIKELYVYTDMYTKTKGDTKASRQETRLMCWSGSKPPFCGRNLPQQPQVKVWKKCGEREILWVSIQEKNILLTHKQTSEEKILLMTTQTKQLPKNQKLKQRQIYKRYIWEDKHKKSSLIWLI